MPTEIFNDSETTTTATTTTAMTSTNMSVNVTWLEGLDANQKVLMFNMDSFFLVIMGIIVFLMQTGFAFLEAGSVR